MMYFNSLQSQLNKIFRYLITHTISLHLYSIILEPKSLFIVNHIYHSCLMYASVVYSRAVSHLLPRQPLKTTESPTRTDAR